MTFNLGKEQEMNAKRTIVASIAILGLVLSLSSGSAMAATYWTDNFDSETVGNQPSNWNISSGTNFDTVVSNTQSVSPSNSILLTDDSTTNYTSAYRNFDPDTDTTGQLTVNTYLSDATEDLWVSVRSGGTVMMEVLFYTNGAIRWRDGAGTATGSSYATGTWKELKITWDTTAGKYHVYYDGTEETSGTGASFVNSGTTNRIVVQNGWGTGTGFASYVDDVSVTPEPATMTLLLLGLPLALRRRRK